MLSSPSLFPPVDCCFFSLLLQLLLFLIACFYHYCCCANAAATALIATTFAATTFATSFITVLLMLLLVPLAVGIAITILASHQLIDVSSRFNFVSVLQLLYQWQCCSHCLLSSLPYAACSIAVLPCHCSSTCHCQLIVTSCLTFLLQSWLFLPYATACTLLSPLFLLVLPWSCQPHCCCCNHCWLIVATCQTYAIAVAPDAVMPLLPVALPLPATVFLMSLPWYLMLLPEHQRPGYCRFVGILQAYID